MAQSMQREAWLRSVARSTGSYISPQSRTRRCTGRCSASRLWCFRKPSGSAMRGGHHYRCSRLGLALGKEGRVESAAVIGRHNLYEQPGMSRKVVEQALRHLRGGLGNITAEDMAKPGSVVVAHFVQLDHVLVEPVRESPVGVIDICEPS